MIGRKPLGFEVRILCKQRAVEQSPGHLACFEITGYKFYIELECMDILNIPLETVC